MSEELATKDAPEFPDAASFAERAPYYRERINLELAHRLDAESVTNSALADAMRYALLGPGKRIRPLLAYASGELFDIDMRAVDAIAVAIEMIHTYSLVHDDLPAMDDDDLRRGRPTIHVAYDEATAILVGDGLHALAFKTLARDKAVANHAPQALDLIGVLANAVGPSGMVDGQALDIAYSGSDVGREDLEEMFARKTGRLIAAAITMPAICANGQSSHSRDTLDRFAATAGLCFQIHDDILDVTGSTQQIGKPSDSDARNDRASYPARFGLAAARERARELHHVAYACLTELGTDAEGLAWLTDYIINRSH